MTLLTLTVLINYNKLDNSTSDIHKHYNPKSTFLIVYQPCNPCKSDRISLSI